MLNIEQEMLSSGFLSSYNVVKCSLCACYVFIFFPLGVSLSAYTLFAFDGYTKYFFT